MEADVTRNGCASERRLEFREGWTVGENGITVSVNAGRHVEWHAGARDQKRTESKHIREANGASEEQPVPDIKRCATIIEGEIVLIRRESEDRLARRGARDARGIAVGVVQSVVAKKRNASANAHITVDDELVLLEVARRIVLIDIVVAAERPIRGIEIGWERGVNVAREQGVDAAGIQIRECDVSAFADLFFKSDAGLHRVRVFQVRIDLVDGRRSLRRGQLSTGWQVWKEVGIGNDEALLRNAVE